MRHIWAYLNDLQESRIEAIYMLHNLIEFVYTKEGRTRSATFCFCVGGGSMGYKEYFTCDSIPLPPAKTYHPLSGTLRDLSYCRLYADVREWEHFEEIECVSPEGHYLLYFSEDEARERYAMLEKAKTPTLSLQSPMSERLPQELFSVEEFKEHLAFALKAHKDQKTPHGLPYSMHLLSVASEVINALTMQPLSFDENNVAIACALLHDVNEDTDIKITRDTPLAGNAEVIAKGVLALSKDKTLPSKEAQMRDSIERLKKRQNCVVLVKLADRISNLGVPPAHWDAAKKRAYVKEAQLILDELGYAHAYLADKLREKITAYKTYM